MSEARIDDLVFASMQLDAPLAPGQHEARVRVRAEIGERPGHEVIHLGNPVDPLRLARAVYHLLRAQEGTTAADWPAGTPLCFTLADAEPVGRRTIHLGRALAADAEVIDLAGCYFRARIGAEVMHVERRADDPFGLRHGRDPRVRRGREGTLATSHAAGTTVEYLAPGQP